MLFAPVRSSEATSLTQVGDSEVVNYLLTFDDSLIMPTCACAAAHQSRFISYLFMNDFTDVLCIFVILNKHPDT